MACVATVMSAMNSGLESILEVAPAASTTDEYVIGYMKSPGIRDYFRNVK